jgi:hypothetical protein
MYTNFNHIAAAEQTVDRLRAAERSRQAAELRVTRKPEPRTVEVSMSRSWLGLRRRPKVA